MTTTNLSNRLQVSLFPLRICFYLTSMKIDHLTTYSHIRKHTHIQVVEFLYRSPTLNLFVDTPQHDQIESINGRGSGAASGTYGEIVVPFEQSIMGGSVRGMQCVSLEVVLRHMDVTLLFPHYSTTGAGGKQIQTHSSIC